MSLKSLLISLYSVCGFGAACGLVVAAQLNWAPLAYAQEDVQGIASVVNDEVISKYDIQQRVNLIIFSSGVQAQGADLERIKAQVQRTLVDEVLKIQEAQRLEIDVSSRQVDDAILDMASQNNMTVEQITKLLTDNKTNVRTLRRQIASDIVWDNIVRGMFGSRVSITDEEIDAVYQQNIESINQPQYLVSEIRLRVESPDKDEEVRVAAEDLIKQLQRGAQFPALARQLSQSPSASQGGDIGWIREGQLAPELNAVLKVLRMGEVSTPIRTVNAYYILALRNKKEIGGGDLMKAKISIRRLLVPIAQDAPQEEIQAAGNFLYNQTQGVKSCNGLVAVQSKLAAGQVTPVQEIETGNLPDTFKTTVLGLNVGETTPPMLTQQGFQIITLCGREDAVGELPTRDQIEGRLFNQQLAMLARRHLRDLRNDAIVDTR